jgi:hypothetical protein
MYFVNPVNKLAPNLKDEKRAVLLSECALFYDNCVLDTNRKSGNAFVQEMQIFCVF